MRAQPAAVPRDLMPALQAVVFDPMPAVLAALMNYSSRSVAVVAARPILTAAAVEQKPGYPSHWAAAAAAAAARRLDPSRPAAAVAYPIPLVAAVEQKQEYPSH
jgi:hypothetical protein